jgi:integrase
MDRTEWKRLLTDAGVWDARLHDARHTAATVLQIGGVAFDASFDASRDRRMTRTCGFRPVASVG